MAHILSAQMFRRLRRSRQPPDNALDFCHVLGQQTVKRASGNCRRRRSQHLAMWLTRFGQEHDGKALRGILPPLSDPDERLEVIRIWSALGQWRAGRADMVSRPVRAPHHTTSAQALAGGTGRPGLSAPSFQETFRSPITACSSSTSSPNSIEMCSKSCASRFEDGVVSISRAIGKVDYPRPLPAHRCNESL